MITYDIFDDVFELRNMVDRFFDEVPSRNRKRDFPYVSIYEGNDELTIKAFAPGLKTEDVNVQLVDSSLIIQGEKKDDYANQPYIRKERLFGKFNKSIKLPYRVDPNRVSAEMKNGILVINLVRSEDTKPKRIEIN